jgi:hypothetical protein
VGNFGNGAEDIAVANGTAGTVTILLNNGTGTFTTSQTLTVGTDPVSLALGDFEGNGHLDLAVANEGSNTVSVFLNNGTGSFTPDATITVGTSPSSVATGDINGDGYCDLVVANSGSNNISVLLSHGNGSFATGVNYSVGTTPSAVVVADFNSDGAIDVAIANSASGTVSVLLGNGNGTLGTATNYTVGSDPVALAAGDIKGDGNMDLVVINHGSNNETILSNDGTGAFTANQTISLGESADSVAVADFANNGVLYQVFDDIIAIEEVSFANPEKQVYLVYKDVNAKSMKVKGATNGTVTVGMGNYISKEDGEKTTVKDGVFFRYVGANAAHVEWVQFDFEVVKTTLIRGGKPTVTYNWLAPITQMTGFGLSATTSTLNNPKWTVDSIPGNPYYVNSLSPSNHTSDAVWGFDKPTVSQGIIEKYVVAAKAHIKKVQGVEWESSVCYAYFLDILLINTKPMAFAGWDSHSSYTLYDDGSGGYELDNILSKVKFYTLGADLLKQLKTVFTTNYPPYKDQFQ